MSYYARFDCDFPDDPKVIQAGDLAELLYFRCVLKCRQTLSDGVIHRDRLPRWAAGINAKPSTLAGRLVRAGLWQLHPDGWQIPPQIWNKWNPTAKEVATKREDEAERKRKYREDRRSQEARPPDVPPGQERTHGTRDTQSESKTETETESKTETKAESHSSSSSVGLTLVAPHPPDDDGGMFLETVVQFIASERLQGRTPANPARYRATVVDDLRTHHRQALERMLRNCPWLDTPAAAAAHYQARPELHPQEIA